MNARPVRTSTATAVDLSLLAVSGPPRVTDMIRFQIAVAPLLARLTMRLTATIPPALPIAPSDTFPGLLRRLPILTVATSMIVVPLITVLGLNVRMPMIANRRGATRSHYENSLNGNEPLP